MHEGEERSNQFVTFLLAGENFALNMAPVQEIIRVPELVKVPKSPPSLLGLANLRGKVLPVISLRRSFGLPEKELDEFDRVIVVELGQTLGFLVDKVQSVIEVEEEMIDSSQEVQSMVGSEFLKGLIKIQAQNKMWMMLDLEKVVEKEFKEALQQREKEGAYYSTSTQEKEEVKEGSQVRERQLVSFWLGREEYAFPIEYIQEIVQLPEELVKVPKAEGYILGLMSLRNRVLPVASLKRLLGLPEEDYREENRCIVLTLGGLSVGVVVDSVKEVLRVPESLIEPVPAILVKGKEDFEVTGICRLNEGRRLVSILSVEDLFKHKEIKEVFSAMEEKLESELEGGEETLDEEEQFVIFKLEKQEYAVPIESVREIVRVPEELTHIPKAPEFVEGVINLRGQVLPVIDLRKRFDLPVKERDETQRIMVFVIEEQVIGFMVDAVTEVKKIPKIAIAKAPALTTEQSKLFKRIANLEKEGRMIQIIEPEGLLNQRELKMLEEVEGESL